ncbi:MAG: 50S ribosomal protein L16, large subunit ribosomal protein L16 [Microgenomates group bacterium GW2011_GWC1_39_7b]|uniref:Large ribosomal subunit protein uL16 n=3 Tax=Candidatus Woeseibacteriota TaxID=1752722 RepID=A0A0G0P1R4_9BACT|nr:MAG: 50S ribosomal protein L16 [Candidatus Woesebacteria bacterium GW2011_GWB1_39_10]KKR26324.1 MAG: 50S ribosomal protein L16, large subunit ribosomal protein L16 [Microgenomates group bacterium GW2011_GWC1_39_7b]KKR73883.1 MAG: 50S ribosomal protein L16 [Candidatus Woesebacteria bacterium GW2011_GWA2_40_7]KKS91014.1 MAG: 50S ribosomal protein L16 [Candidatus Woesebacteria bacterium GW2011_GWA1_43_12]
MLQPKRRKFIKDFRGRRRGLATRGSEISFGDFAMKAQEVAWVTSAQIESARRTITHNLKKGGRVWVRIFPDKPITSRPAGKRMGGGKGDISTYVAVVKPGMILYEVAGAAEAVVREAMRRASAKLPIDVKIMSRTE